VESRETAVAAVSSEALRATLPPVDTAGSLWPPRDLPAEYG
jgi:hypothetical protein